MRASDMLAVCRAGIGVLDGRKREFVLRIGPLGEGLTGAQWQFLQSCYDEVVSKMYGVEEAKTNEEWARDRAILKRRTYGYH